ncbi:terpene cyclase/mutase family protein [bacterium]|nr:terpene cyclase/mutase family protein [bacterium]
MGPCCYHDCHHHHVHHRHWRAWCCHCGCTAATESAVEAGLRWLARHQSQDGSWSAKDFTAHCKGAVCNGAGEADFDVGVTSLAVLAFLGAGLTPANRATYVDPVTGETMRFGVVLKKGLQFLIDHQNQQDGMVGPLVQELMYNYAIAALALCEAYGMTKAVCYRAPAQKAVMFILAAQNLTPQGDYLGWRYTPRCGNNDTSVTGWCVLALKSARIAGLDVRESAFDGAKRWILRVTDANGRTGYDKLGSEVVVAAGRGEAWMSNPSMTAIGLLCRTLIDRKRADLAMAQAAKILTTDLPKWEPRSQHPTVDYYYWHFGTLALFQYDGPDGPQWRKWNHALRDTLCQNQCIKKDGCADGSWPTEKVDRWGYAGGRVYGTAMNVLTLECYYRHVNGFPVDKGGDK